MRLDAVLGGGSLADLPSLRDCVRLQAKSLSFRSESFSLMTKNALAQQKNSLRGQRAFSSAPLVGMLTFPWWEQQFATENQSSAGRARLQLWPLRPEPGARSPGKTSHCSDTVPFALRSRAIRKASTFLDYRVRKLPAVAEVELRCISFLLLRADL